MARIGGEEFGILMPHCPPELAVRVVDRIRHLTPPPETCSAGIALLDRNETFSETMARADKALYLAKEGGRNRSVFEPA
jgi:diguanylate cyclase (GGDEF)-like protein